MTCVYQRLAKGVIEADSRENDVTYRTGVGAGVDTGAGVRNEQAIKVRPSEAIKAFSSILLLILHSNVLSCFVPAREENTRILRLDRTR